VVFKNLFFEGMSVRISEASKALGRSFGADGVLDEIDFLVFTSMFLRGCE